MASALILDYVKDVLRGDISRHENLISCLNYIYNVSTPVTRRFCNNLSVSILFQVSRGVSLDPDSYRKYRLAEVQAIFA